MHLLLPVHPHRHSFLPPASPPYCIAVGPNYPPKEEVQILKYVLETYNSKTIFVAIIFATSTDTEPIFTILSGDKTITKKNNKYHINSDASSVYMISCPYGTNIELIEGTL